MTFRLEPQVSRLQIYCSATSMAELPILLQSSDPDPKLGFNSLAYHNEVEIFVFSQYNLVLLVVHIVNGYISKHAR